MTALDSDRPPRLLDVVRSRLHAKHYSPRTEEAYVGWIRRFVRFHRRRHPREMGEGEVVAFLSALALESHVAASTQNQALSASTRTRGVYRCAHSCKLRPSWGFHAGSPCVASIYAAGDVRSCRLLPVRRR